MKYKSISKNIIKLIVLISLLFGLPLLGIFLSTQSIKSIERYTTFPPISYYTAQGEHIPFSWTAFNIILLIILIFVFPIFYYTFKYFKQYGIRSHSSGKLPLWGKFNILFMIFFWVIAWGRFELFAGLHDYTFFLLWTSFTVMINALQYKRTGKCLMAEQPVRFLFLFPVSAVFWWYFEYINGFVQNWYYLGSDHSWLKIFLLSTLSFSTVLPAVLSISCLLSSYAWINKGFTGILKIKNSIPKLSALFVFIIFSTGLTLIGIFPDYLFPFVWVSPFFIIVSLQIFFNERHIFSDIADGNWSLIVSASIAALICGVFWEMWNFYSMPKWQYSIPLVHRFLIFEMPVLGYSGYLPFGLLCISISKMIKIRDE